MDERTILESLTFIGILVMACGLPDWLEVILSGMGA